ncbi:MAG TPA: nucleotidyltransferase family protein [Devosia sp.]|nr:nucleotidyltransferase family protein [Devosia sp.]
MTLRERLALQHPTAPRGRFPSLAWAWPTGPRDLLLRAAILSDLHDAAAAYDEWQRTVEFESATMAEQRLLVAISYRMPEGVLPAKDRARLTGVERKLWTHSRVALRAAESAFAALVDARIEVMVLKGAGRAVVELSDLRGRYASDVDLLVRPRDYVRAVEVLRVAGWDYLTGPPHLVSETAGLNLMQGQYGQVDIHQYPYHQLTASDHVPDALWSRATRHTFLGYPVLLPSATDQLTIALAHGGISGHGNSDWLVDSAQLIESGEIDWALFEALCAERRVEGLAAISLSYLGGPLQVPAPTGLVARLEAKARRRPVQLAAILLEARPKREYSGALALTRTVAKVSRMVGTGMQLKRLRRLVERTQQR